MDIKIESISESLGNGKKLWLVEDHAAWQINENARFVKDMDYGHTWVIVVAPDEPLAKNIADTFFNGHDSVTEQVLRLIPYPVALGYNK